MTSRSLLILSLVLLTGAACEGCATDPPGTGADGGGGVPLDDAGGKGVGEGEGEGEGESDGGAPDGGDPYPFCDPLRCADVGATCGPIGDGCGGFLECGSCDLPETCGGGGVPSQCGAATFPCTPRTCEDAQATCGPVADGCGGLLQCGSCDAAGQACGGDGVPNQCGGQVFSEDDCPALLRCEDVGAACGVVGNGCGGTLECGSCTLPETCGGGGVANQCGAPTCTPLTCADVGASCGPVGDGCGALIPSCGSCTAPESCGGGGQPSVCGLPQSGPPAPDCGNGVIDGAEVCDDGNQTSGDGCAANCFAIEPGYRCPTPGELCQSTVVCGDGLLAGAETCDDRNAVSGDGCDEHCRVETGWSCPVVGAACQATRCGDGHVAGFEECDDGNNVSDDGCSATCTLEEGHACGAPGSPCTTTSCGDGTREGAESCDDGNFNTGDGCSPSCRFEPVCAGGSCEERCGDGIMLGNEECDDGNTVSGDGCSATCQIEPGFTCNEVAEDPVLTIVYRDFVGTSGTGNNAAQGQNTGPVHRDFEKYASCRPDVQSTLDSDGKPALLARNDCVESSDSFEQWYRSDPSINRTIVADLPLSPVPGQPGTFEFFDSTFFPLDGLGWNDPSQPCGGSLCEASRTDGHNFHFTSEVRYWFIYRGGERLTFDGDDDVWVYIDDKLAVDIGGLHSAIQRWIQLPDPNGVVPGAPAAGDRGGNNASSYVTDPMSLGLVPGNIYEVAVFQAERHTTASQYRLTLRNFLSARSVCDWQCGDGVATRFEVCDDGAANNTGGYGRCNADCLGRGPFCGDGIVQSAYEECDDGDNVTVYLTQDTPAGACAPGCVLPTPLSSCQALTCENAQAECGILADGCGDFTDCGGCGEDAACHNNSCVSLCAPLECSDVNAACGVIGDGCGATVDCGPCPDGLSCGGGGVPHQCGGSSSCEPFTCEELGARCGVVGDGCGGTLDCGGCPEHQSCGGGGVPYECGTSCVPTTCEEQGANCGYVGDGCGNVLPCGTCPSPLICGFSQPNVCGFPIQG